MAGGKGKSTGGKAGPKEAAAKTQKSHSAKAGLQVRKPSFAYLRNAHTSTDASACLMGKNGHLEKCLDTPQFSRARDYSLL